MTKPFLKWVGGKARFADAISALLPRKIRVYREGFLGGGALFFRLAEESRFESAVLTDVNQELITTMRSVRDCVDDVATELEKLTRRPITKERYYKLRGSRPRPPVKVAARMIVLNKTGFNGLYRVNSKGGFNSPWGKRETFDLDIENLRSCSRLLQRAEIICGHYDLALQDATDKDAVYLDPPYASPNDDNPRLGFRQYSKDQFGSFEQDKLASACKHLTMQGVPWVASNADTKSVRARYQFAKMRTLEINRTVGCKKETRVKIGELLIWDVPEDSKQVQILGGAA